MSDGTFSLFESMLRCNGNIRFIIFMRTILQRYWHDNCSHCGSDIWRIVGLEIIPLLVNWRMCEHNCKTSDMDCNNNIADSRPPGVFTYYIIICDLKNHWPQTIMVAFGHEKCCCNFNDAVAFGHNQLWRPPATKIPPVSFKKLLHNMWITPVVRHSPRSYGQHILT